MLSRSYRTIPTRSIKFLLSSQQFFPHMAQKRKRLQKAKKKKIRKNITMRMGFISASVINVKLKKKNRKIKASHFPVIAPFCLVEIRC